MSATANRIILLGLLVAFGSAMAMPITGVIRVDGNLGAFVDSLVFRFTGGREDSIATPEWGRQSPGTDTFDFSDLPGWPLSALLHYRAGGIARQQIIPSIVEDTWYQLIASMAQLKFYSPSGVSERPEGWPPTGSFEARPSVVGSRTAFHLQLPAREPAGVEVFNAAGILVRRLEVTAGASSVTWDRTDADGDRLAPGVYLARLIIGTGDRAAVRKLILTD